MEWDGERNRKEKNGGRGEVFTWSSSFHRLSIYFIPSPSSYPFSLSILPSFNLPFLCIIPIMMMIIIIPSLSFPAHEVYYLITYGWISKPQSSSSPTSVVCFLSMCCQCCDGDGCVYDVYGSWYKPANRSPNDHLPLPVFNLFSLRGSPQQPLHSSLWNIFHIIPAYFLHYPLIRITSAPLLPLPQYWMLSGINIFCIMIIIQW